MKKAQKTIIIILMFLVIAYISYTIYLLITDPTDTYIIKEGSISEEDTDAGYVIRVEKVLKDENQTNGIYQIATEGEKVSKSDSIFRYYSDSEKEITQKINELNYQIQEKLEQDKNQSSADIKAIENQIESKILNIRTLNDYQEITEYKSSIDSLISKKVNFIGDITENKEIKQLINERKSYEEKLKKGLEYKKAEISGIVSYRVDGLEEEFTEENFSKMTEEFLNEKELRTGQIVATSNDSGKVIDNFKCYIAVTMNSERAMEAKIGDKVDIRTATKNVLNAKIVHINEESGKRTIIFQTNQMTENLINHRKIAINIIWWSESGLKVPNQSLIEENGLYYVIRSKAGIQTKTLVKLKRKTDKFSIITSYKADELKELGYDEKDIKNYKKINNYDEILLNP